MNQRPKHGLKPGSGKSTLVLGDGQLLRGSENIR